jgi:ribosomal protein S27AE
MERLECGHGVFVREDALGTTTATRRRCSQCGDTVRAAHERGHCGADLAIPMGAAGRAPVCSRPMGHEGQHSPE